MKEHGDKLPPEVKSEIESGINTLKGQISADDVPGMKATMSDLEQKLMKLGEAIYAQQQAAQQAGAAGAQPNAEAPQNANDGDFVDAEVVDDK